MAKVISHRELSSTLNISERIDGFWIYDKTRGMNLSKRAKTAELAWVEVVEYYQERLLEAEKEFTLLRNKIESFVGQFVEEN